MHFYWLDQVSLCIVHDYQITLRWPIHFKGYHCSLVACQIVIKEISVGLGSVCHGRRGPQQNHVLFDSKLSPVCFEKWDSIGSCIYSGKYQLEVIMGMYKLDPSIVWRWLSLGGTFMDAALGVPACWCWNDWFYLVTASNCDSLLYLFVPYCCSNNSNVIFSVKNQSLV